MATAVVLLIMAGCAAFQYFKGTFVRAFATIIAAICASVVAFGFFELLADVFVSRSGDSKYAAIVPWAQPSSFVLLFVVVFGLLQTGVTMLTKHEIDLGTWAERIGRVVCGVVLGLFLSGLLLTTLAMAPLPNKYPYERFDERNPDAEKPGKAFPNADGFATGWFSMVSKGSLSGRRSFAALHPGFLDQVFLNRHKAGKEIRTITSLQAIEVPSENGAWYAPESLRDSDGNAIPPKTGHNLMIVRIGIKRTARREASEFTPSQLRLICKKKVDVKDTLGGKGQNIYPIGYLKGADELDRKKLSDEIGIDRDQFEDKVRWIDFAFYVPGDMTPVLAEFKLNSIAEVPSPVTADEAPAVIPFSQTTKTEQEDSGESDRPSRESRPRNRERRSRSSSGRRGLSDVSKSVVGPGFDDDEDR